MSAQSIIDTLDANPNVGVGRHQDAVRSLDHVQDPWSLEKSDGNAAHAAAAPPNAVDTAREYLLEVGEVYGIPKSFLNEGNANAAAHAGLSNSPPGLRLTEERSGTNTTTVSYQQTLLGLPVWHTTVSITLNSDLDVVNSSSNVHPHATEPQKPQDDAKYLKEIEVDGLREVLALGSGEGQITINQQRLLVYQYRKEDRQALTGTEPPAPRHHYAPTLILNAVPDSIQDGRYYVVREVLFTLPLPGHGTLNWRAFIEVETGTVLYLRAFTSGIDTPVTGELYTRDPPTRKGAAGPLPEGDIAHLNLLRETITLSSLTPTSPQALTGKYAVIKHIIKNTNPPPPNVLVPTTTNNKFVGDVESDVFAAVNAYHHVTFMFELVEGLGLTVKNLFRGTTFPVALDHRGYYGEFNARALGNSDGKGMELFDFGVAAEKSKIGIAADLRLVAHEFGHALLYGATHTPNFGFAHSAGDSLGAILCDPGSQAPNRFETFPWVKFGRYHNRDVAQGWAWGGPKFIKDTGPGYQREQILSTSLFRIYQAIGGDALNNIHHQRWASRYVLHLIIAAIEPITHEFAIPDTYVSNMIAADNKTILEHPGGAIRKVIRWSFEVQGLFQPASAKQPYMTRGAPPQADVYINDGRSGEYGYSAAFDNVPGIWNRHQADGIQVNQAPAFGATNYLYVNVQNRGTDPATGIQVKAYVSKLEKPQKWDAAHTEFDAITLSTAITSTPIPVGGSLVVGPFTWTAAAKAKHTLLVSVSSQGDLSNIDNTTLSCATGPIDLDRLVPFDNNLVMLTI
jgi:hypothetical protein